MSHPERAILLANPLRAGDFSPLRGSLGFNVKAEKWPARPFLRFHIKSLCEAPQALSSQKKGLDTTL
jgi:hypothetical protein